MPGFFVNKSNGPSAFMQYLNVAQCGLLAISLWHDPESFYEVGMDLSIHFLNARGLRENTSHGETTCLLALNLLREGALYHAITERSSHLPFLLNLVEALVIHPLNTIALILNTPKNTPKNTPPCHAVPTSDIHTHQP